MFEIKDLKHFKVMKQAKFSKIIRLNNSTVVDRNIDSFELFDQYFATIFYDFTGF